MVRRTTINVKLLADVRGYGPKGRQGTSRKDS